MTFTEQESTLENLTSSDLCVLAAIQLSESSSSPPIPCSQLAKLGNMPERFLLQVLRTLVNQGLLKSTRGVDGGYRLARPLSQISLLDIIEATDGPIQPELPQIAGLTPQSQRRLTEAWATSPHDAKRRLGGVYAGSAEAGGTTFVVAIAGAVRWPKRHSRWQGSRLHARRLLRFALAGGGEDDRLPVGSGRTASGTADFPERFFERPQLGVAVGVHPRHDGRRGGALRAQRLHERRVGQQGLLHGLAEVVGRRQEHGVCTSADAPGGVSGEAPGQQLLVRSTENRMRKPSIGPYVSLRLLVLAQAGAQVVAAAAVTSSSRPRRHDGELAVLDAARASPVVAVDGLGQRRRDALDLLDLRGLGRAG